MMPPHDEEVRLLQSVAMRTLGLKGTPFGPGNLAPPPVPDAAAWTFLKPSEMKSEGGATLKLQKDGSILVSGEHPAKDSYTLTFRNLPAKMQALRLEVLPHDTLPNQGPGRGVL